MRVYVTFACAVCIASVQIPAHGRGIKHRADYCYVSSEYAQAYSLLVPSLDASKILRLQLGEDSLLRIPCHIGNTACQHQICLTATYSHMARGAKRHAQRDSASLAKMSGCGCCSPTCWSSGRRAAVGICFTP